MKKLIIGDSHIKESAIPELEIIFQEILQQDAKEFIHLGDYYDNKRPTAKEIIFGTKWMLKFKKKYKKVILIRGNHEKTGNTSIVDYFTYMGIKVLDEYIDKNNCYYSHFMTNKSLYEYGSFQKTVKELRQYNYTLLGHQHNPQALEPNMYHLGSVRYCQFNEVTDPYKRIAVIEKGKLEFIKLNSPIPMIDVKSISEVTKQKDRNCKIRLVISSFDQFKEEVNEIAKWKDKFVEFKVKLDFSNIVSRKQPLPKTVKRKRLQEILQEGIAKIEDTDVKNLLQEQLEEIK